MNSIFSHKQASRRLLSLLLLFIYITSLGAQSKLDTLDNRIKAIALTKIPAIEAQSFEIDTTFANRVYKENFKIIPSKVNLYDLPYSITDNYPNYKRLALNTGVLYGAGFLTLGVLYLLPEDATAWNKEETINTPPFKRWWRNVRKGPVIDKDNAVFNYILHPYGGAAYYMGARSVGFNLFYSFLYTAAVSTFFWEYGIEAFMEIPSLQDLIITPIAGVILGEGFYKLKRHIVNDDYKLFGSSTLGNIVAYIIDPINEVIGLFAGNPCREKIANPGSASIACVPWFGKTHRDGASYGFTLNLTF